MYVGNDIVDLNEVLHPRFAERICEEGELSIMLHKKFSPWLYWAVKESAYKALKKQDFSIVFAPKKFLVRTDPWECQYKGLRVDLQVTETCQYVHAIAVCPNGLSSKLRYKVARRDESISESEDVRKLANDLLEELGYCNCTIINKPPQVFCEGRRLYGIDVSLSHDGRFIAAVISIT